MTCKSVVLYAISQGAFLVGFTAKDGADVAAWFSNVEPGFPVSHCTNELLPLSLGEALYADYRNPLADVVKPSAAAAGTSDGPDTQAAAATSTASEDSAAPSPEASAHSSSDSGSGSNTSADMLGSHKQRGSGSRPVGIDTPQPTQFRVHAYTELLPMPRIAILSGLSEMEWVGICELWDTTGTYLRCFCLTLCQADSHGILPLNMQSSEDINRRHVCV